MAKTQGPVCLVYQKLFWKTIAWNNVQTFMECVASVLRPWYKVDSGLSRFCKLCQCERYSIVSCSCSVWIYKQFQSNLRQRDKIDEKPCVSCQEHSTHYQSNVKEACWRMLIYFCVSRYHDLPCIISFIPINWVAWLWT